MITSATIIEVDKGYNPYANIHVVGLQPRPFQVKDHDRVFRVRIGFSILNTI